MSKNDSDSEILHGYQRKGFVFPLEVMSAEEAIGYRRRIEAVEAEFGDTLPVDRFLKFDPHYLLPVIDELIRLPRLLDLACSCLGPDLLVSNTNMFLKGPHSQDYVTWHQDMQYVGLKGDDYLTIWLALTPSTRENGCMQFLRGSHRERLPHHDTYAQHNMLTRGQSIVDGIDPARVTDVILKPGQASVHHGWMAHASGPNLTSERRMGLVVRYMAPHLEQVVADYDYGVLVRGEDPYGNFISPPRPTNTFERQAIERYEAIREARQKFLFNQAATVTY